MQKPHRHPIRFLLHMQAATLKKNHRVAKRRKKKIRALKLPKGTVEGAPNSAGGKGKPEPPAPDPNDYDPTHVEYNPTNDSDFTGGGK